MTKKHILIISNEDDLHARVMTARLTEKGYTPFYLNLDAFPREYNIHQSFEKDGNKGFIQHIPSARTIDIERIGSVWIRRKGEFTFLSDDLSAQQKAFAIDETEHTLMGLLYGLDCYWMSHPLSIRHANYKGEQIQRAARIGFRVPPSIISNAPDAVRSFKQGLTGDIVFKAMSSAFLAAGQVTEAEREADGIPTTVLSDEDMHDLDAVALVPCHFQGYIDKAFELRVTVIGDKVFTARIDSQLDERTRTDFRDFSVDIPYSAVQLPDNIEQRCRALVRSYGLNFGALDLIVTPEGEYVFLEINPVGQFWFVEQLVPELTMMDTLAECLIEGLEC